MDIPPGLVFAATDPSASIAESFDDFVSDGPSDNRNLTVAGVRPSDALSGDDSVPALFWTGSEFDGALGETCVGWQDNDLSLTGHSARTDASGAGWISDGPLACNGTFPLLCACWSTEMR